VLTLYGKNFGASLATVFVGTVPCISTSHQVNHSHEVVFCTLPSGRGTDRPVLLLQDVSEQFIAFLANAWGVSHLVPLFVCFNSAVKNHVTVM
jgi:hypothetical protein